MDVRIAYDYVKACLSDPTVNKVVLIGHSQGGIIVSQVLDHLYSNVPLNTVSKLVTTPYLQQINISNPLTIF